MSNENLQKARVLLDGYIEGRRVKPNNLVVGDPAVIAGFVKKGWLDASASAVKYCESLGDVKPIELFDKPEAVEVTEAAIAAAIKQLDPKNEDHWTKSGAPNSKALEKLIGAPVKAADRDAVWKMLQDGEIE
ncbi:hypothetical protein [Methylophaga lonarensis]|uniref:hypothetical protein n=1 Tax=Methylophaga lonarensis TaxID=999151 RepID=UPI003D2925BE